MQDSIMHLNPSTTTTLPTATPATTNHTLRSARLESALMDWIANTPQYGQWIVSIDPSKPDAPQSTDWLSFSDSFFEKKGKD